MHLTTMLKSSRLRLVCLFVALVLVSGATLLCRCWVRPFVACKIIYYAITVRVMRMLASCCLAYRVLYTTTPNTPFTQYVLRSEKALSPS